MKTGLALLSVFAAWGMCMGAAAVEQPTYYATVEEVCQAFPAQVKSLFEALDLTHPGLEEVKRQLDAGNVAAASAALIEYYEAQDSRRRVLPLDWPRDSMKVEDPALLFEHTFPYKLWTHQIPLRPDGGWDWAYNGPDGKDPEFGWALNRHFHLLLALQMYEKTNDTRYREFLDKNLQDWVVALPPYPNTPNHTPQWRGLEVAIRVHNWATIFYALEGKAVSSATRLLMLTTVADQAHYNRYFHSRNGNWGTIEMEGLSAAALAWPEFRESGAWWNTVIQESQYLLEDQIYPDGVQNELTSHYHTVVGQRVLFILFRLRIAEKPIPPSLLSRLEAIWDYCAYAVGPDIVLPQNNDSGVLHREETIEQALLFFDRPDWRYIISNGKRGKKPTVLSLFYPWAGQGIMRDGWDRNAQWAFFDMGPLGAGHYHFDKLHLSVRAGGRELLLDAGSYGYLNDPFRAYVVSTKGHNTLLVDGAGQKPYEKVGTAPITGQHVITKDYDYFRGTFDGGYENVEGTVTHTRAVVYLRGEYWVVVDKIVTDRPRRITALWHLAADSAAGLDGLDAVTFDKGKENLRITPAGEHSWELAIVKGQREPEFQGWSSPGYNAIVPSPTAVYTTSIPGNTVFVWVLTPGRNTVPRPDVRIVSGNEERITVEVHAEDARTQFEIPLEGTSEKMSIALTSSPKT